MASTVLKGQEDIASKYCGLHESLAPEHSNCDVATTINLLKVDIQHYDQEVTGLSRAAAAAEQLVSFQAQIEVIYLLIDDRSLLFW